jgi:hypothetical protein
VTGRPLSLRFDRFFSFFAAFLIPLSLSIFFDLDFGFGNVRDYAKEPVEIFQRRHFIFCVMLVHAVTIPLTSSDYQAFSDSSSMFALPIGTRISTLAFSPQHGIFC